MGTQRPAVINAVELLRSRASWDYGIGIEVSGVGHRFWPCCYLLEEDRLGVGDSNVRIITSCCHRSAVIASINAKHPGAVAVQPAVAQSCGGGDGGASHLGVDDAGGVADVRQVDIGESIQEEDAVAANGQWHEATDFNFRWGYQHLGFDPGSSS